ncbi:hypothetical protein AB0L39_15290 [Streptomyces parvus]
MSRTGGGLMPDVTLTGSRDGHVLIEPGSQLTISGPPDGARAKR